MEWIRESVDSIRSVKVRRVLTQVIGLGLIATSSLIIWKGLMCISGSESPVVVVLSGSMDPGFKRVNSILWCQHFGRKLYYKSRLDSKGDILFLHMNNNPIRAGEIVVFNVDEREIPIVH